MSEGIEIGVSVEDVGWDAVGDAEGVASRAARAAFLAAVPCAAVGSIEIVLTDDATVQELNRRWRDQDKPTNVLSFPGDSPEDGRSDGPPLHFGDVILGFATVRQEAEEQGKTLADHTTHLVVHGVLHLFGFDHQDDDEAEEMEGLERTILGQLGIADPYRVIETAGVRS